MDHQYQNNDEEVCNKPSSKASNVLPLWGNERTMNLNQLILTNIQSSHYFKVNLYELKTYHEVVDEIYYKVAHLEPWEKGSRRTSGQTGMCGGVRGVGAGGIVSTAYCLLYKLFTLKLTRKQLNGLISHCDSPYIRALGFMYIRYVFPPASLLDWYEPYLDDEEEVDVKAGGGQVMKMGMILRQWLVKLEWFSTLFPRIPVPIQQKIQKVLEERFPMQAVQVANQRDRESREGFDREKNFKQNPRDNKDNRRDKIKEERFEKNEDHERKNRYDREENDRKDRYDRDDNDRKDRYDREDNDRKDRYDRDENERRDRYDRDDSDRKERYRDERIDVLPYERKDRYKDDYDRKDRSKDDYDRKDKYSRDDRDRQREEEKNRRYRDRSPHKERHRDRQSSKDKEHRRKKHHHK